MYRIFRHYVPKSQVILGSAEAVILTISVYVGAGTLLFERNPVPTLLVGGVWPKALGYAVLSMFALASMGLYERGLRDEFDGIAMRLSAAAVVTVAAAYSVQDVVPALTIGRSALVVTVGLSFGSIALLRGLVYYFLGNSLFRRRVLVLGCGTMAAQIEQLRRASDRRDLQLQGFVQLRNESPRVDPAKILQIETTLVALARRLRTDEIVVGIEDRRLALPINDLLDCKMSGIRVIDLMSFFERQTGRIKLDAISASAIIYADGFVQAVLKNVLHRAVDIVLSVGLLAFAWPLMVLSAFAIAAESGFRGPVLYRQVRTGKNGRPFSIIKFRSMTVDAETSGRPQWATANDVRVTRVGAFIRKTRIDELPQLFNVLGGQMSFVGPRPERPEFVEQLSREIPYYHLRHRVNPGITGWAQICYPYGASQRDAKEKLQYDLYYIKNYSLFLDLTILLQTAQVVLWGKGAR